MVLFNWDVPKSHNHLPSSPYPVLSYFKYSEHMGWNSENLVLITLMTLCLKCPVSAVL